MLTVSPRLCFVHNQVNARLRKPEFDCSKLDSTYDCGCGDAPVATNIQIGDNPGERSKDDDTGAGLIKGGK
jgi:FAD-linked sulfhydryl oxidase